MYCTNSPLRGIGCTSESTHRTAIRSAAGMRSVVVIAIVNSLSTIAFHIALSPADLRGIASRDRRETVCESAAVVE